MTENELKAAKQKIEFIRKNIIGQFDDHGISIVVPIELALDLTAYLEYIFLALLEDNIDALVSFEEWHASKRSGNKVKKHSKTRS